MLFRGLRSRGERRGSEIRRSESRIDELFQFNPRARIKQKKKGPPKKPPPLPSPRPKNFGPNMTSKMERVALNIDIIQELKPPDSFLCPQSKQIMTDPVIDKDGKTYQKSAYLKKFKRSIKFGKRKANPPQNWAVKNAIEAWQENVAKKIDNPILNNNVTKTFEGSISLEVFEEPVTLIATGQTYEKETISSWLRQKDTDPMTGMLLTSKGFVPNKALKGIISAWKEEKAKSPLGKLEKRLNKAIDSVVRKNKRKIRNIIEFQESTSELVLEKAKDAREAKDLIKLMRKEILDKEADVEAQFKIRRDMKESGLRMMQAVFKHQYTGSQVRSMRTLKQQKAELAEKKLQIQVMRKILRYLPKETAVVKKKKRIEGVETVLKRQMLKE